MMDRRAFVAGATSFLAAPFAAKAQQAGKVYRVGWLATTPWPPGDEAFQRGLRDVGWIEGRNVITEYRFVQGKPGLAPELAAELVSLKVDLIVAIGGRALAAKSATSTIPIVFVVFADPVRMGLAVSLARPGGNLTGLTSIGSDLITKKLELLKEAIPGIRRVAVLGNVSNPLANLWTGEMNAAAQSLGLHLQRVEVRDASEFERTFSGMAREQAGALMVPSDATFSDHRREIAALALKHRLPTMFDHREHVEAGGLMFYAVNDPDLYRRAATYVDKILKGAKPGDLPIEQPTKFEFVINLKTAKALGLTIPPSLLARADAVIE